MYNYIEELTFTLNIFYKYIEREIFVAPYFFVFIIQAVYMYSCPRILKRFMHIPV